MGIKFRARYEGKALRPLREIELVEGEEVDLEIKKSPVDEFHGKIKIEREIADEIINMEMWD